MAALDAAYRVPIPGTDWKLVQTNRGRTYYYHPPSKKSSWSVPEEVKRAIDSIEEENAPGDAEADAAGTEGERSADRADDEPSAKRLRPEDADAAHALPQPGQGVPPALTEAPAHVPHPAMLPPPPPPLTALPPPPAPPANPPSASHYGYDAGEASRVCAKLVASRLTLGVVSCHLIRGLGATQTRSSRDGAARGGVQGIRRGFAQTGTRARA